MYEVDWNKSGGLVECNWPCCLQSDSSNVDSTFRIIHEDLENVSLEVDVSPSFPPLCFIACFMFFPLVPFVLCSAVGCGYIYVSAWTFQLENGQMQLHERIKYGCSETYTIPIVNVRNAIVEYDIQNDPESGRNLIRGRIVIIGNGDNQPQIQQHSHQEVTEEGIVQPTVSNEVAFKRMKTPWRLIIDDNLDIICQKILQMIPSQHIVTNEASTPIQNPFIAQQMIRDATIANASFSQPSFGYYDPHDPNHYPQDYNHNADEGLGADGEDNEGRRDRTKQEGEEIVYYNNHEEELNETYRYRSRSASASHRHRASSSGSQHHCNTAAAAPTIITTPTEIPIVTAQVEYLNTNTTSDISRIEYLGRNHPDKL
jgi:hypothetical protein